MTEYAHRLIDAICVTPGAVWGTLIMSSVHIINARVPGVLFCHTFIMHERLNTQSRDHMCLFAIVCASVCVLVLWRKAGYLRFFFLVIRLIGSD